MLEGVHNRTYLIAEKNGYRWEGGCSGMDNTPRGRTTLFATKERPNNPDMLWIDAICQQTLVAKLISSFFSVLNDNEKEMEWFKKFEEKRNIINSLYWNDEDEFYYDIDCNTLQHYKVMSIASFWVLISEVAPVEKAEILLKHLFNPKTIGGFVPFVSLSRNDNDYKVNGEYWRGSVWLPTAYATLKGIVKYGFYKEAQVLGSKLLNHMYKTFEQYSPHTIWECYSPEEYKPASAENEKNAVRPDFCGWSALGPIAIYIEFVLGFHTINAFTNIVEWFKPESVEGLIGIKNLRFGNIVTDIVADENKCTVISNKDYTLIINGNSFAVREGANEIFL